MIAKRDGTATRTPEQLERKYKFGETFAEIMGIAVDAQKAAAENKESFEGLDQEAVFNILTNNGQAQGLYRDENGNIFINASYIAAGILSSADGKIKIDLASGGEPVFNTGVSTNGISVRGDQVGAKELFHARAETWEQAGFTADTFVMRFYNTDGNRIGGIAEAFALENGKPVSRGIQAQFSNIAENRVVDIITLNTEARVQLRNGRTSDADVVGFFAIRSDGKSQLSCDSINPGKKRLFTGSVAVGSTFTVPNTADYDLFAVKLGSSTETESTVVLAYKVGNTIRGVGGWSGSSTEYKELFFLSATFSGNTWTLVDARSQMIYSGSVSDAIEMRVKEVIGVI